MENTRALSARRDMFLDERGTGLRVSWHPERDLVVLSVWHDDSCVGTFRMLVQDVPRLSGLLAAALDDWVDQAGVGGGPMGGGARGAEGGGQAGGGPWGGGPAGGGSWLGWEAGLSARRRIRLSRPVLRLRGLQYRRRGSA